MKADEIIDNFTKIPNSLFAIMPHMSGSSFKVLMHIARQTIGYNKKTDGISISQFSEYTGLSERQVAKCLKELKKERLITLSRQKRKDGGNSYNRYSLNAKGIDTLMQKMQGAYVENAEGAYVENAHTKENNITKEERELQRAKNNYFLTLPEKLQKRYAEDFIDWVIANSAVSNPEAYKIKIRKRINKRDKEQLLSIDRWLLGKKCNELKAKFANKEIATPDGRFTIESIYPYSDTVGWADNYFIYVSFIGQDGERETKGFTTPEEAEEFLQYALIQEIT